MSISDFLRYGVKDEYSGAAFAQQEASDTKAVTGTYTVALPDGRTQVSSFHIFPFSPIFERNNKKYFRILN